MTAKNPTNTLNEALQRAGDKVAPVWPLESFVAVNPYFGMAGERFEHVAHTLRGVAGAKMAMPLSFYLAELERGRFTEEDVACALQSRSSSTTAEQLLRQARLEALTEGEPEASVPSVADIAKDTTGEDWVRFVTERVSVWASCYFDEGQAIWRSPTRERGVFASWRAEALLDRTPEVTGLVGFRRAVAALPEDPVEAAREALERLGVPDAGLELYLHRLLMRVAGWSAYAARVVWDARLYEERRDSALEELLCVLLVWEAAMLEALKDGEVVNQWQRACAKLGESNACGRAGGALERALVLQQAYEAAAQRRLIDAVNAANAAPAPERSGRPKAQAIFCIDVRSEVYRRHLEAVEPEIETLGFAGFFAFPVTFTPLAHEQGGNQCPVLLTPTHEVVEGLEEDAAVAKAVAGRKLRHEVSRAWQTFKMGAISCFSFVGPVGLAYLPKLFKDGMGWSRPVPHPADEGLDAAARDAKDVVLEPKEVSGRKTGIPLPDRVEMAAGALGAMSLTTGFARLVLITGHGSTTVNNPHATGLDCGACGGRTGEANARVAASVLNDPRVREGLRSRGIDVPEDTVFLACQHDTTTDEVSIFNRGVVPATHAEELRQLEAWLCAASQSCREDRASRLGVASEKDVQTSVLRRSRDWAQVRPEWGLANCSAFIVAPRDRTERLNLEGRSFLHSYAWQQDDGFGVLELIMTAPMVVASWISLQYYASTVDNRLFGCGNKTLHNVVGMAGVFEGNGGDLRVGLPWQSLHDGERLQHEPMRLNVVIEAPREAMNQIIQKHELVKNLLDNEWLNLFAMNEKGEISHRYVGGLEWISVEQAHQGGREELAS